MFWIEITATIFGLICVVLTIRRNIWCWPTGLVQVILFIAVFYHAKLYSDLILHGIYVFLQLYGWHCWRASDHGAADEKISIGSLPLPQLGLWIATAAAGTAVWGYIMQRWTDADFAYGDAFTTVASLIAQYLLARRRLENWLFWIVVDVVAIGIYLRKGLLPTTVLYTVFLGLAITGLVVWRRRWQQQIALAGAAT